MKYVQCFKRQEVVEFQFLNVMGTAARIPTGPRQFERADGRCCLVTTACDSTNSHSKAGNRNAGMLERQKHHLKKRCWRQVGLILVCFRSRCELCNVINGKVATFLYDSLNTLPLRPLFTNDISTDNRPLRRKRAVCFQMAKASSQ